MSSEIKINRNQRRWHKYGKLIIGLAIAAAAAIIIGCIAAAAAGGKKEQQVADNNPTESVSETVTDENGNVINTEETSSEPQKESATLKLEGTPAKEEYTSASSYENSVFMGDVFVRQLPTYGLIDDYYIWSSNYFTTDKAVNYVNEVAELKPEKLFLMFGFDDSSAKKAEETMAGYEKLIGDLKAALPDTKIYLISEMPVSKEFDEEEGDITQKVLDEVNTGMADKAAGLGVTFIDAASAFKSGEYIGSDYTTDGYHIAEDYYPFVLNGIAKLIK